MKNSIIFFTVLLFFVGFFKAEAQRGDILWQRGHITSTGFLSFSPDSTEILSGDGKTNLVIRSSETGNIVRQLPFNSPIRSASWSPNGDTIAITSSDTLFLLRATTGEIVKRIPGWFTGTNDLKYSPDGTYLLNNTYMFKTADYSKVPSPFTNFSPVNLLILPGDTNALYSKSVDSLVLISIPSGKIITHYKNFTSFGRSLAFHKGSGRASVISSDTAYIFKVSDGTILQKFYHERLYSLSWSLVNFTPDGNFLLIGGALQYNTTTQEVKLLPSLSRYYYSIYAQLINKTGKAFITTSISAHCFNSMIMNDIPSNERIYFDQEGYGQPILSAEFLENYTKIRTTHSDSVMITWDMQTGDLLKNEKAEIIKRDTSSKTSITAPNGKYRLEITQDRGLILRDAKNDSLLRYLQWGYTLLRTYAVMFTPDSKYIIGSFVKNTAGGGPDTDIKNPLIVWDVETGKIKYLYDTECGTELIYVTPGNRQIVAISTVGSIFVLDSRDLTLFVEESQPENFLKTTIYPNPLQESGMISYSVSAPGLLKISVHDIFGREIMVLKNEFSEPGKYTLPFKSSELSSGPYFLKVTGSKETSTTHFSILR